MLPCPQALSRSTGFNPLDIAITLNALAKFERCEQALVTTFCHKALAKANDFSAKQIGNTLNALAKLVSSKCVLCFD